jgi:hypothetical protein
MWVNGGITPLISLRHRIQVVCLTCLPLHSRGKVSVRSEQVAVWVSQPVWTFWTKEYLWLLPGLEPKYLSRVSTGLVTISTALVMAIYLIVDLITVDVNAR